MDYVAALGAIALIAAFIFAEFSGRGAYGAEELRGRGRLWGVTVIGMLAYVSMRIGSVNWRTPLVGLTCLWIVLSTSMCAHLAGSELRTFIMAMLQALYCPVFLLFFYVLAKRFHHAPRLTGRLFLLVLVFCSLLYWKVFQYQNVAARVSSASLNDAYYALLLLPFALLSRESILRYGGLGLVSLVIFWSMKRTGLLALVMAVVAYFAVGLLRERSGRWWPWVAGLVCASAVGLGMFAYVAEQSGGHFISRIEGSVADGGSGRLGIYGDVLALQARASLVQWVLGHGPNAVETAIGVSAHSDWLEVLFDYGVPGIVLYAGLHFTVLLLISRLVRHGSEYAPAVAASYAIFFALALTSHLVTYGSYFSYLMAFWGIAAAEGERIGNSRDGLRRGNAMRTGLAPVAWAGARATG